MTSILTNNGAMTALQTLKNINSNLETTQSQISTGKKVGTAKDNAAVWAISKTMEADVGSFNKLSEGLSVASSTVAVARDATETITGLLKDMKEKAVQAASATTTDADRTKIDADVQALREQINSVVGAAQFNGVNLIDGKNGTGSMDVLSSLDRSGTGNVAQSAIQVDFQDMSENNAAVAQAFGGTAIADDTIAENGAGNVAGTAVTVGNGASHTFEIKQAGEGVSYRIDLDGGDTFEYVANANDSSDDVARKLGEQLSATYGGDDNYVIGQSGNKITVTNASGGDLDFNIETATDGTAAQAGGLGALGGIDVIGDAAGALTEIDAMIAYSIDAAAAFGTAQNQLDTQNEFVGKLTDSMKSGIGAMVDADMEEASARLQALQVQQQLGTQALSIANQAPQSVLSLFR